MRAIAKGHEPPELKAYRAVPGATYDGKDFTPVKDGIRTALLRDQLALCCYCMRRISSEARPHPTNPDAPRVVQMKVEHWRSQTAFASLQLAWTNLLGACLGNEGRRPADQTCDTRKGEEEILLNPLDPAHVSTLSCTSAGRLQSTDPRFQKDIDDHLGLNHPVLVGDRKVMLDRDLKRILIKYRKSPIPESAIRTLVTELETPTGGRLPELCSVVRLWARKRYGAQW
ncbi:hypothetical protein WME75_39515 [Sorangium sp. So ce1014]|uniref:hypothetical protein n=1 Tax=Sorangium sp. So ce1014 TaxID=3133326 RepID=UPI003F5DB481